MPPTPKILPLNQDGTLYSILDDEGQPIGTGSREICEFLSQIIVRRTREGQLSLGIESEERPVSATDNLKRQLPGSDCSRVSTESAAVAMGRCLLHLANW